MRVLAATWPVGSGVMPGLVPGITVSPRAVDAGGAMRSRSDKRRADAVLGGPCRHRGRPSWRSAPGFAIGATAAARRGRNRGHGGRRHGGTRGGAGLHPRHRAGRPGGGPAQDRGDALSAGAQRLPAHRPRQVDLPQLRHRPGVRRPLPPALRRHQPDQGGAGVHRRHRARRALARLRLGQAPLSRVRLLRAALRLGRAPDQGRQGLRRRPEPGGDARRLAAR